jgi:L-amino acid N-acyltransferase
MVRQATEHFPVLVAVNAGGGDVGAPDELVGFTAYGHFRGSGKWPGYGRTVEHSIHVAESSWGRGVGRQLLTALIERARNDGFHVMVAAIDGDNVRSIAFHGRLGFVEVARMPEVGHKFGRWLDLVLVQLVLDERRAPPNEPTQ